MDTLTRLLRHVGMPALVTLAVPALSLTPVEVFGCANRGWFALGVVAASTAGSIGTTAVALRSTRAGDPLAFWWVLTSLVLLVPAVQLVIFG